MKANKTTNSSNLFYQRLFFSFCAVLLVTSLTLVYKNWVVTKLVPKAYVTSDSVPTQNLAALVTVLTIPTSRTSSEVQTHLKPKPTSANRSSPESRTDSRPKTEPRDRSSPEVHDAKSTPKPDSVKPTSPEIHSEVQIDSNLKLDTKKRSLVERQRAALSTESSPDVQPTTQPERRRSLLIYGADRSGTTFTTKMFAEDPQLMTVYEPLWITSRWNKEDSTQVSKWKRNVLDLLTAILGCKFAKNAAGIRFLSNTASQWCGANVKNPFQSLAFCPNAKCINLANNSSFADSVCKTKYTHSVTKIGEPRTPQHLVSSFLPMVFTENPDTDIRVIQLIRDPRASISSRIDLGWQVDYQHSRFNNDIRIVCSDLAQNIKFGRNLGKWQDKYMEVHYRDLAGKPLETTSAMYKFAGFEMPDSIQDWVRRNTSPSKKELNKQAKNKYSPVRNSTAHIDKWRKEAPIERIRIIEKHCTEALDLLGLIKIT